MSDNKRGLSSSITLLENGRTVPLHVVMSSIQRVLRNKRNLCKDKERCLVLDVLSALLSRSGGRIPMDDTQYLDFIKQVETKQKENPDDPSWDDAALGVVNWEKQMVADTISYNADIKNVKVIAAKEAKGKKKTGDGETKVQRSTVVYKKTVHTVHATKSAIDSKEKQNLKELVLMLATTRAELMDGTKGSMIELMPAFDPDNTEQALDLLAHFSGMSMAGFKQSDPTKELFHIINSLFSGEIETDKNGTLPLYSMGNNAFLLESHENNGFNIIRALLVLNKNTGERIKRILLNEMTRLEARPGENIHALADRANSIITSYVNANSHESQQVIDAVTDDLQELFLARLTQIVLCTSEGIQQNVHALVQKITDNGNISRAADIVASESEKWLPVLRDMVVISDAPNSGASNTTNAWNVQRSRRGTSTGEAKSSVLTTPQKIQKFGTALSKFCEGHDKDWILMHGSHAWSQCTRVAFEMRDAPKFVDSFRRFKKSCPPHLLSIFEELYSRNSNRNRSDRNDNNGNYQNNNFGGTVGGMVVLYYVFSALRRIVVWLVVYFFEERRAEASYAKTWSRKNFV